MLWWLPLVTSLIGAGASVYGANKASKANKAAMSNLEGQQAALAESQAANEEMLNSYLDRNAADYQAEAVGSNLAQYGGIEQLMQKFGVTGRKENILNAQNMQDMVLGSAGELGIDPKALLGIMRSSGMDTLAAGNQTVDRANSLINGQFYNSPVGQQQLQELTRNVGSRLTPMGQRQMGNMGMASGQGEVDMVSQFLLNANQNAQYGDQLLAQGLSQREMGTNRLGGVLNSGMQFGQYVANAAQQMSGNTLGVGRSQLIDPNMSMQSDAWKASLVGSIMSSNAAAAGTLGTAAAGIGANQAQAMSNMGSQISKVGSDYMKYSAMT